MFTVLLVIGCWFALSILFTVVWALLHLPRTGPVAATRRSGAAAGASAKAPVRV